MNCAPYCGPRQSESETCQKCEAYKEAVRLLKAAKSQIVFETYKIGFPEDHDTLE